MPVRARRTRLHELHTRERARALTLARAGARTGRRARSHALVRQGGRSRVVRAKRRARAQANARAA
eukprot:1016143-Pleurochrysis_carterae.AAC.1